MDKKDFRILFMGTPEFAVASLDALVKNGFNVVAVVTMPDKPQGRGMKLTHSAVKAYATEHEIEVLQPEKLKDEVFVKRLGELKIDLAVVVAFRMLPEIVWQMPRYGTINLHGSLLPKYRGAAPINWAIIKGEQETGVTTFRLKHVIDTGDIILQEKMPITHSDNAGTIHDKMKVLGADVLVKTVEMFLDGEPKATSQTDIAVEPTPAPKLNKENTLIDFSQSAFDVFNFVRGLSPYPSAWCSLKIWGEEHTFKIFETSVPTDTLSLPQIDEVGNTAVYDKNRLFVKTADGVIEIIELQESGKKRMKAKDFINGLKR